MTTPADIDAIRERANAFQATMAEWQQTPLGTQKDFELIEAMEEMRDLAITDRDALLAAYDAQAERVRTLEAALGTFMVASRLMITNNMLLENDGDMAVAYVMIDKNDDPIPGTPCLRAGWFRQLETAHKQAADALAANADAGNGGA